jgi:tetratricopeptide (TPR) repeat protein
VRDRHWFHQAVALESIEPDAACEAYRRALADDATNCDAYVNLGRLLHELGRLREAEAVYTDALDRCGRDATLLFNFGVLQEDLANPRRAADSYRAALSIEPDLADAHFNLARLCASQGLKQEALRHWSAYRKLTHA